MLDAAYFKEHLNKQVCDLGFGACSVSIHLTDGSSFIIKQIDPNGVHSGYVLLEVFPLEGITKESKEKRKKPDGTNEVFFDRVAIPYEYITRVFLTVIVPESQKEHHFIGFSNPQQVQ